MAKPTHVLRQKAGKAAMASQKERKLDRSPGFGGDYNPFVHGDDPPKDARPKPPDVDEAPPDQERELDMSPGLGGDYVPSQHGTEPPIQEEKDPNEENEYLEWTKAQVADNEAAKEYPSSDEDRADARAQLGGGEDQSYPSSDEDRADARAQLSSGIDAKPGVYTAEGDDWMYQVTDEGTIQASPNVNAAWQDVLPAEDPDAYQAILAQIEDGTLASAADLTGRHVAKASDALDNPGEEPWDFDDESITARRQAKYQ